MSQPSVRHGRITVNGVDLHHVTVGSGGAPTLLIPGWPQSWFAWRMVAPLLAAAGRTVYVVDPRGLGDSGRPTGGYDLDTVAADLSAFAAHVGDGTALDVVAHDVGVWIAHAWAVTRPDEIRTLTLVDAAVPGVTPPPSGIPDDATNVRSWHFGFNRLPQLPEILLAGRERAFLSWLFASKSRRSDAFDEAALDEYARVLGAPGAVRAGMEYYREIFSERGLARSAERAALPLPMPVLTVGGAGGVGHALYDTLSQLGRSVTGLVLDDCGHYVPEEQPEELAVAILAFWAASG